MFGFSTRGGKKLKEEEEDNSPSEREIFGISGPTHLTSVNWNNPDHRRSIAASLVQGVYILERDRQQNRQGTKSLAPIWWDYFNFQLLQILVDKVDGSSFGAIFEYTPKPKHHHDHHHNACPLYVLAFRGTVFKSGSRARDLNLDMQLILNGLTRNSRYQLSLQSVQHLIAKSGDRRRIWLASHSLGAAIALQAGKETARLGCYLETYLFNPPFASAPIEKIKDQRVKDGIRIAGSFLTAGLSHMINSTSKQQHYPDPFQALSPWVPYMFIHPNDPISSEYAGYFEHRERMDSIGLGGVERIATGCSVVGLISGVMGRDAEAPHLVPSGFLVKNMSVAEDFKTAHGIHQWWKPHKDWVGKLYRLEDGSPY